MKRNPSDLEFHKVFERITDAYVALDAQWRYTYLNEKAGQLFGRQPAELIGKHIWSEFPEGVGQPFHRAYEQALTEQRPIFLEEYYSPHGRWFENRIYPSPEGLTIYFLDVTERKTFEEKLNHSRQMLDEAQQVAHMGSWEWRIGSDKIEWTTELYRIYGMQPAEFASFQEFVSLIHPDDRAYVQSTIERALGDGRPFQFEERICHADGSIRVLASRGEVLRNPEGIPDRMVGVCQDVTEQKRRERMEAGQHDILAGIAAQQPLNESLARIAKLHEELNPGAFCTIVVLDPSGERIADCVGPSLPEEFNRALRGLEIGDRRGSCGTAAWRGERIIVDDVATHSYWAGYRELPLAHGLRACWSTALHGKGGKVVGTYAVYYRDTRVPTAEELDSIDKMLSITAIAIDSERLISKLRERDRFFEVSREIFCIFDPETERIVQVNPTFCEITGYEPHELTAPHYSIFVHPDDKNAATDAVQVLTKSGGRVSRIAYRFLCKDGGYRWLEWESITGIDRLAFAVAHDITERRRVEEALAFAASHDAVTGLPHHLVLERRLGEWLAASEAPVRILFVGLDRFQAVNESMGHVVGDEILKCVAERLQAAVGAAGAIARFAGDEFVVAAPNLVAASTYALAERLRAAVAQPIEGADYRLLLTSCIGISSAPEHGRSAQELLRRAEAAMTSAKRQGRDTVCEFSVDQMREIEDRILLGRHLRGAAQRGELSLNYQPQRRAADSALSGFEALLRWDSQELGSVPPARFIPIAEALGLMPEIGEWVLGEACRQARTWLDRGFGDFSIAVNVSAQQLQRPGLIAQVRAALKRHAVPPRMLSVELTESSLMENLERASETLGELKGLGIRLSLDDFGTGYSSLACLKQIPIDTLKIDQSFVRGLPSDADDAAIACAIVAMAHRLRLAVAAEGVERAEQAQFLTEIGCDVLQGHYLGHPLAATEVEKFFVA